MRYPPVWVVSISNSTQISGTYHVRHTDAIYKLNYEGFPVLVFGVSDATRALHPLAIALSKIEQTVNFGFFFRSFRMSVRIIQNVEYKVNVLIADTLVRLG